MPTSGATRPSPDADTEPTTATPPATDPPPPESGEATGPTPRFGGHRRILAVAGVVVLVAGAVIGTWLGTRSSSGSGPGIKLTTTTASVTTGTMKQTVSASGTIEPASEAALNFAVSGKVTAVDVAAGTKVTAGQTLATVDPTALNDDVAAAQASLSSAQAKLASDQAAAASTSQIDSDQAAVTSAQSDLTTAQTNLTDASLTSTITGTVAAVDLSVGQEVTGSGTGGSSAAGSEGSSGAGSAEGSGSTRGGSSGSSGATGSSSSSASSSSTSSTSAQITVVSTSSYNVTTSVDDTEVNEVKAGDQAVITPSGSTTEVYGLVSSVGLIASSSSSVASFPVTIQVTGTPSGLYAGASATVSIIVKQLNDVTEVPTAAITYTGGKATVTRIEGGKHVSVPVTTGTSSGDETQITSGVAAGDKIVERQVTFSGGGSGSKSIFGRSGSTRRGGGAGGFGGEGGAGGAPGGAGGFGGAGGGGRFGGGGAGGGGFGGGNG